MPPAGEVGNDVKNLKNEVDIFANGMYIAYMTGKKAEMGRPPKAPKDRRSYRATVRLTPEQYHRLTEGAKMAGVTLSTYILSRLEA